MLFTFVDFFSGIGGIRLAFERAAGECVFSSDIDKFACRTYYENFGDHPAGDIMTLTSDEIPKHDILVAGFPCQPFSLSGVSKRNSMNRPHGFKCKKKGHLFFRIVEIMKSKRPKAFLLENVKHLAFHNKGETFRQIQEHLDDAGYDAYAKIIDSSSVVPQRRERIYIVGFRKDLDVKFDFPRFPDFQPKLRDILDPHVGPRYTISNKLWSCLRKHKERQRRKGNGFGYGLADLDGVTRTLSARYHKDGAEILIPQERKNPRRLTPRECARLMGFPASFNIPVSDTQAYRQFGNAVVVPIVERIAQKMVECLCIQESLPPIQQ